MPKKQDKPHLFVVDDEAPMRILLQDFLDSQGFQVRSFSDAKSAIQAFSKEPPVAVISDIRMFPINGFDLMNRLRKDNPTLPILLFTGASNPEEKSRALKMGATHYFAKPFSLSELKTALDSALHRVPKKA